jgi:hypothetical protein
MTRFGEIHLTSETYAYHELPYLFLIPSYIESYACLALMVYYASLS